MLRAGSGFSSRVIKDLVGVAALRPGSKRTHRGVLVVDEMTRSGESGRSWWSRGGASRRSGPPDSTQRDGTRGGGEAGHAVSQGWRTRTESNSRAHHVDVARPETRWDNKQRHRAGAATTKQKAAAPGAATGKPGRQGRRQRKGRRWHQGRPQPSWAAGKATGKGRPQPSSARRQARRAATRAEGQSSRRRDDQELTGTPRTEVRGADRTHAKKRNGPQRQANRCERPRNEGVSFFLSATIITAAISSAISATAAPVVRLASAVGNRPSGRRLIFLPPAKMIMKRLRQAGPPATSGRSDCPVGNQRATVPEPARNRRRMQPPPGGRPS